jgi:hypothetical protein
VQRRNSPPLARLTKKQIECTRYQVEGGFTHFMSFGGGRSTKTFRNVRLCVARCLAAPNGRHAMVRAAQKHIKASLWLDTFPKVMRMCFPGIVVTLNRQDLYVTFPNGSELWFLGLDDADRTEKILGMEFATIFYNECSQLSFSSVEMVWTRLAQRVVMPKQDPNEPDREMPLLALYDCNPPRTKKHWTYQLFFEKKRPDSGQPLPNPQDFGAFQMNPKDNPHLPEQTKKIYQAMGPAERKRFWEGEFGDAAGGLWSWAMFKALPETLPSMVRVVIGVDPPGGSTSPNVDGRKLAEAGIVVAGLGDDGKAYILRDCSLTGKPEEWGARAVAAYYAYQADAIIGEVNQGGDMVRAVIHAVDTNINFIAVRATRGKAKRAEPVAALYGRGKVLHARGLDVLENQLTELTEDFDVAVAGYSPDRADALVWAVTALMLEKQNGVSTGSVRGT